MTQAGEPAMTQAGEPAMAQAGGEIAACSGVQGRRPPVTRFDRVQVLGTLKTALVQGRLTEDEYDGRVDQASAAQTHADLAALIADIPAGSGAARPPTAKDVRTGIIVVLVAASTLGALLLWQPDNQLAVMTALLAVLAVIVGLPMTVGLMIDVRHQKRSGRQLPSRPPRSAGR